MTYSINLYCASCLKDIEHYSDLSSKLKPMKFQNQWPCFISLLYKELLIFKVNGCHLFCLNESLISWLVFAWHILGLMGLAKGIITIRGAIVDVRCLNECRHVASTTATRQLTRQEFTYAVIATFYLFIYYKSLDTHDSYVLSKSNFNLLFTEIWFLNLYYERQYHYY
jgi:hypothetical protein